jgi:hypothetical protein
MLVYEDGGWGSGGSESGTQSRMGKRGSLVGPGALWLARATPRAWLEAGKRISVKDAPTHLGPVSYEIVSEVDRGKIAATVAMPPRPGTVILRLRHPKAAPMRSVTIDGRPSEDFDRDREAIRLSRQAGTDVAARTVKVEVRY